MPPGITSEVAMPYRNYQVGDQVFVRATVLEACSDLFQIRIEDVGSVAMTTWAPASEIAKVEDIGQLKPIRRSERFLDR